MAGETVLAVDDREDSLKFLREYVLEPNGYQVIQANNGADALDLDSDARTEHAERLIMQLRMMAKGAYWYRKERERRELRQTL